MYGVIWFWHIVTVLTYGYFAFSVLARNAAAFELKTAIVLALLAAQLGCYVWFYVLSGRYPFPAQAHAIYFGGGLLAWTIEYLLYPDLFYLLFTFMGQAFGLLAPAGAFAVMGFVLLMLFDQATDWRFDSLAAGQLYGMLIGFGSLAATYLFIYGAMRTSASRGQLIQELEQAKRELESSRRRDAELAVLRDRERIARDMHDSLGHALVALTVQLEAIQRLYRVDPERASAQVDQMKVLTRDSMDALRRSITGLRESGLSGRALGAALSQLCVSVGDRAQLDVKCMIDPALAELPGDIADVLWAVAQEVLVNVQKHARARSVTVTLRAVLPVSMQTGVAVGGDRS
jgi:signal transduction histidine kinase